MVKTVVETEKFGEVTVNLKGTKNDLIKRIRAYGSKELVDKGYVRLFGEPRDKVSYEDVNREIEDKVAKLNEFLAKESIVFWLEDIKLKKNGKFMKNSVVKVFDLENCCRFSEKEGYKYLVPRLQLKAVAEDEVMVQFEERWESFL